MDKVKYLSGNKDLPPIVMAPRIISGLKGKSAAYAFRLGWAQGQIESIDRYFYRTGDPLNKHEKDRLERFILTGCRGEINTVEDTMESNANINRQQFDLKSVKPGDTIAYQIGSAGKPTLTTVNEITERYGVVTAFSTDAGTIAPSYVLCVVPKYVAPKSQRTSEENILAIVTAHVAGNKIKVRAKGTYHWFTVGSGHEFNFKDNEYEAQIRSV